MQCCQFLAGLGRRKITISFPFVLLSFVLAPSLPARLMFAQTIISEKKMLRWWIFNIDFDFASRRTLPASTSSHEFPLSTTNSRLYGLIDSLREVFASSDDASPFTLARRFLGAIFDGNVGKKCCAARLGVLATRLKVRKGENAVLIGFDRRSSSGRAAQGSTIDVDSERTRNFKLTHRCYKLHARWSANDRRPRERDKLSEI